jgi:hypothetical protein
VRGAVHIGADRFRPPLEFLHDGIPVELEKRSGELIYDGEGYDTTCVIRCVDRVEHIIYHSICVVISVQLQEYAPA